MPRVSETKSLVKLCIKCITNAIESSKFAADPSSVNGYGDVTTVNSLFICNDAFHQLPAVLVEEIMQSFISSQKLKHPNILSYLITPQIQRLTFPVYFDGYLSFFPKLENLHILHLQKTLVDDSGLQNIGIYCSQLRSLNLNFCSYVTDDGIRWLCAGVDFPGMGKSKLCKTIQKLSIVFTSVTKQGIQVALQNLLSLKVLENIYIVDALVELSQSAIDSKQPGRYNNMFSISTLYTSDAPYKDNSLPLALSLCHSINNVSICVTKDLKDRDLLCLLSIKSLHKIDIYRSRLWVGLPNETGITFDGCVVPLLKVFGRSLKTLMLESLHLVCISSIIEFCPNLTTLYIGGVLGSFKKERDLFKIEKKPPILKELKVLYCVAYIPVDIIMLLWGSSGSTVKYHQFEHLKKLELVYCSSVTGSGIEAFLVNGCNSLETMNLKGCTNLRFQTYTDLCSLIAKKNWDLNISIE
ncbi:uncharacterized protein LOC124207965 [Daphnia pulex]|uniref:uncharacterized protein LOC124207965 n=1 Tax=Daphnia pulex TaxID=6669 RepID=UPI001EDF4D18|nr:uncharacterized protein LOC124207965 [Daphnia pulex]